MAAVPNHAISLSVSILRCALISDSGAVAVANGFPEGVKCKGIDFTGCSISPEVEALLLSQILMEEPEQ